MREKMKIRIHSAVLIIVLMLLGLVPLKLYSEEAGFKYFKNYSSIEDYQHQPQNWGIAQDKNGIIYVANQAAVLIYDGVSWQLVYVPNLTAQSLTIDETGTVYIGGNGEIGYLDRDEKGSLKYASLMDNLDDAHKKFSNVWRTFATEEGIYFNSFEFLFRWDPVGKKMKVWEPTEPDRKFIYSFKIKGKILIQQWKSGIMHLVDDKLELLVGGEVFSDEKEIIYMIAPYDPRDPGNIKPDASTLLIGTRVTGFHLYDGKRVIPFASGVDGYLSDNIFSFGTRISTGDFALATRRGGIVIMDPPGHLKYIFNRDYGLQDNDVKNIFEDNQGNLWLALNNGISKIENSSPFFLNDDRDGLPGIVLSVIRHRDDLYVGTTTGLYMLNPGANKFTAVAGLAGTCWGLLSTGGTLLAAFSEGVYLVDGKSGNKQRIITDYTNVLQESGRCPGRIWCGTRGGLVSLYQKNDQWAEEYRYNAINQEIHSIAEDSSGNVWLGTLKEGVLKVDLSGSAHNPMVLKYDTSNGLPGSEIYVAWAAGHVILATEKGIFRYDEKSAKFIPDHTLGDEFAGNPKDGKPVFRLVEDKNNHIWFSSESRNYQAIPGPNGAVTIDDKPFRRMPVVQLNNLYPDPNGKDIWFGCIDGLTRFDKTIKKNYDIDFSAIIREVVVNGKTHIFGGSSIDTASHGFTPILTYKDRNLRFTCAAPFFENESSIRFRYLLEGYDNNWWDWTSNIQKDYTNINPGRYKFRVQAKNIYENLSREGVFQFKILPPWYRTWWAFTFYALVVFIMMSLVVMSLVKWRSRKLEREKQRLDQIVEERTREIDEKNKQLEQQTHQLEEQSEKLKELDEIKSRFFANISHEFRTPLTLIMGPLEQMRTNIHDPEQQKQIDIMLQNSQRLLTLINQLLGLSQIDSGKMKLEASRQDIISFLEGILTTFEVLAQHNRLELEFYSKEEEIAFYFDTEKMEEVMTNLLINAIQFTPAGGKITVSAAKVRDKKEDGILSPEVVEISVEDTGTGIPGDQLPHIFDRFYQAEHSIAGERVYTATGIGLALTKELVELHHGSIRVESTEGQGTRFIIRLPMGKEHLESHEIISVSKTPGGRRRAGEISDTYRIGNDDEIVEPAEAKEIPGKETGSSAEPQGKDIILVVDDNSIFRKYLQESLKPFYTVLGAVDGNDGINKAKERIPDLIISDVMMPGRNGYELCKVLKEDIKTSHIPIILLTANASEESIIRGLGIGADDYITKPYTTSILIARIKNLIEQRRQQRKKPGTPPDDDFFKKLHEIIEQDLANPDFNEEQLCQKFNMSQLTLFRKIQALTDETPTQYIQSYRLERAAQLLKDNFGSVAEVAYAVGFTNTAEFARCFKEKFKQLPTAYQQTGSWSKSSPGPGTTEES